jgi:PAS domain S-box-containing protein
MTKGDDYKARLEAAEARISELTAERDELAEKLEQSFGESNAVYERLDAVPGFAYLQRSDYTIAYANRLFLEHFGEPGNRHCYEILRGRDTPCEECPTFRVFRTEEPEIWEWMDSRYKQWKVIDLPYREADGEMLVLEIALEVEGRPQNEDEIRLLKKRYQALFDHNPLQIYAWQRRDGDFFLVECNEAADLASQGKAKDFIGQSARTMYWDQPRIVEDIVKCYTTKAPVRRSFAYKTRTGGDRVELDVGYSFVPPDLVLMQIQDVTERKQAENEAADREATLRGILRAAPIGIGLLELPERNIKWVNKTLCDMLGYEEEELKNRNARALYPSEEEYRRVGEVKHPQVEKYGVGKVDTVLQAKDGRLIDVILSSALRGQDGKTVVFTAEDVTERKRAERELLQSENKYRNLFQNSAMGILITNRESRIEEVNARALELLGFDRSEIVGALGKDLVHSEDLKSVPLEAARTMSIEDDVLTMERRYLTKSGDYLSVDVSIRLMDERGGRYLVMFQDASDRKRAEREIREREERFRAVIENMPVLVDAMDKDGTVIFWNKECERVTGYSKEEIVGNPEAIKLLVPDDDYREAMRLRLQEDRDFKDWEWETTSKDGSKRLISWTNLAGTYPIPGWDVWGVGLDVTERRRAESEMKRGRDRLQALVDLSQMTESSESEIGEFVLQKAVELTDSETGFINFMDEDEAAPSPHSHSGSVMRFCETDVPYAFTVEDAELWAEAVRTRKPIIINDYERQHAGGKDLSGGRAPIKRLLVVPIFDAGDIVIVAAVANKTEEYDKSDIFQVALLMEGLWSRIKRDRAEEEIRRSLVEKELLLKEVHHRVKNNLQVVSSLLEMSARRAQDGVVRDAVRDMQSKVMAMSLIHNVLYDRKRFDSIDMGSFSRDLYRNLTAMYDPEGTLLQADFEVETVHLPLEKAVPCGLALNEALTNVFKHATIEGRRTVVRIEVSRRNGEALIRVADEGPGFGDATDVKRANTLGLKLIGNLIELQLKGSVELSNEGGAVLTMRFSTRDARYPADSRGLPEGNE